MPEKLIPESEAQLQRFTQGEDRTGLTIAEAGRGECEDEEGFGEGQGAE